MKIDIANQNSNYLVSPDKKNNNNHFKYENKI